MQQPTQYSHQTGKLMPQASQQAWEQFEHTGSILAYLRYKGVVPSDISSWSSGGRDDLMRDPSEC